MYFKLFFFIFITWSFASCGSSEHKVIAQNEVVTDQEKNHVFAPGEHIFWSYQFKDNILTFTVELAPTWMTYSQYNENFMGPLPTIFSFDSNDAYELVGGVDEALVKMKFDKEANEELTYFENKGIFTQKIKIKTGEKFVLKGNINFMTCNQHGCEPPADYPFEIEITP
jgi:thiol:disulfide interchange protein DsbD